MYNPWRFKTKMENISEKFPDRKVEKLKSLREWYKDFKKGKKCKYCTENDSRCLDFHHINPKTKHMSISKMVSLCKSKRLIMKEIKKCDVLCSNCHRKEHYDENRTRSALQKWLLNLKRQMKCTLCPENTPCCLDFHHVNPENKKFAIGDIIKMKITKQEVMDEMEKCEIMCSNCHRKFHN